MATIPSDMSPDALAQAYATHRSQTVERWRDGSSVQAIDQIAEEVPVAMIYNGISHAVMLATPHDLAAFGLGFSLSEGILANRSELYDLECLPRSEGIELHMTISQERFVALKQRRRNLAGRTGCGLCGTESLQQVRRPHPPLTSRQTFTAGALHVAMQQLPALQQVQSVTGAVHAAAWVDAAGRLQYLSEDIGRHNALDKLIGRIAQENGDFSAGFAIVTSRASYEMVQKSVALGIPLLAAVSAPTTLAIELANEAGLTLVGFARNGSHVVYATPYRLNATQETA